MKTLLIPFTVSSGLFLAILAIAGLLAYWPMALIGAAVGTVAGLLLADRGQAVR